MVNKVIFKFKKKLKNKQLKISTILKKVPITKKKLKKMQKVLNG